MVWNADYLRNVGTHTLLAIDTNHVGDARFFDQSAALAAISRTNAAFGCADVNCSIAAGATIADFANNGLDSGANVCGGGAQATGACIHPVNKLPVNFVPAFGGINPQLGVNQMLFSGGRSLYNAFQTSLRANVRNPFKGIKSLNWQISYALSRYDGDALDSDFVNTAIDNNKPNAFLVPTAWIAPTNCPLGVPSTSRVYPLRSCRTRV